MHFYSRPHKAQYHFYKSRIEKLEEALTFFLSGDAAFPFPEMHELLDEIYLISNSKVQAAILTHLNEKIIGRLDEEHNRKFHDLYVALNERISELTSDNNFTENENRMEFAFS
jgi:hypothetical protein